MSQRMIPTMTATEAFSAGLAAAALPATYVMFYKSNEIFTGAESRYFGNRSNAYQFFCELEHDPDVVWAVHIVPTAADGPILQRIYKRAAK